MAIPGFMRVHINGEMHDVPDGISLQSLLEKLQLPQQRVAVELNAEVIRRSDWTERQISADDKIEIVHFVGGG